jgi:tetratricopeptide (TPR) repeat protein
LAIHAFERALELLGDVDQDLDLAGDCLIRLARAHRSLGDLAAAEHCVERLLAFDTQQPEVHLEHAWIAFDHGHMDLAVERAQRARALLRPEHGDLAIYVTQSLGYALAELGRRDEARRELEAFLAARPDDRPASRSSRRSSDRQPGRRAVTPAMPRYRPPAATLSPSDKPKSSTLSAAVSGRLLRWRSLL